MKKIIIAAAAAVLAGCSASPASLSEVTDSTPAAAMSTAEVSQSVSETARDTATGTKPTTTETEPTSRTERETEPPQDVLVPEYIPADETAKAAQDIQLWASENELLTDEDPEIIWYAMLPVECSPEAVGLIDADTGKAVATLNDIADYKKYGGDIMGDGVYNCRFVVDTDINTDDDVSEQRKYHYYAEFSDEYGLHRSDTVEIAVYEAFTEKELSDMETVDKVIHDLLNDEEFKSEDTPGKIERVLETLHTLAAEGLVIEESISADDSGYIGFEYRCGISGGTSVVPFDYLSTEPVR